MIEIRTALRVIHTLGGYPAIAKITGADLKATYNWGRQGFFPAWTYVAIQTALEGHGKSGAARLWPSMRAAAE
jgi:hypothetical protein